LSAVGQRPPVVNLDAIPREITVKAGRRVDLEIPFTGEFVCFSAYMSRLISFSHRSVL